LSVVEFQRFLTRCRPGAVSVLQQTGAFLSSRVRSYMRASVYLDGVVGPAGKLAGDLRPAVACGQRAVREPLEGRPGSRREDGAWRAVREPPESRQRAVRGPSERGFRGPPNLSPAAPP
jgi:hypothetical protein